MTRTRAIRWAVKDGDQIAVVVLRAGVEVVSVYDTAGNRYTRASPTCWYAWAAGDAPAGSVHITVEYDGPAAGFQILGPNDAD